MNNSSVADTFEAQRGSAPHRSMRRRFLSPWALAACLCALVGGLLLTDGPAFAQTGPSFGSATIADMTFLSEDAGISITLPEASGGTAPLTYSLSPALPWA